MVNVSNNGNIIMNRGDTLAIPVVINRGTKFAPDYYALTADDIVYFALEEYNQRFEDAMLRKAIDVSSATEDGFILSITSEETEYLLPGDYYYEIKLKHFYKDDFGRNKEFIDTIVPRKKFTILE